MREIPACGALRKIAHSKGDGVVSGNAKFHKASSAKERLVGAASVVGVALMLVAGCAQAEGPASAPAGHAVTTVTLYSEARVAPGIGAKPQSDRPPIQIVDGGVKSAEGSCWEMDESGQIRTVPGDCYVLRSAPGEKPPAR